MKLLYLVGNGLDLSFGMKTSYKDFYESLPRYIDFTDKENLITLMMEDINANIERWSDMESALGRFTSKSDSPEEFIDLLEFINSELKKYLVKQQTEAKIRTYKLSDVRDLAHPENKFGQVTQESYRKVLGFDPRQQDATVDIVTFNYTNTLERFFNQPEKGFPIEFRRTILDKVNSITHVHGTLNQPNIVLGVDNETQIKNESFQENDDILDYMIKSRANLVLETYRTQDCLKLIKNADVIIIYGLSLGETDRRYWDAVAKTITEKKNKPIIYYPYTIDIKEVERIQGLGKNMVIKKYKEQLIKLLNIDEFKNPNIVNKIFIRLNAPLFKAE